MKCTLLLFGFLALTAIYCCVAEDLIVGTSYNGRLIWQQKVEKMSIPFKKRIKEVFYSDPSQQILKGIIARDLDHTSASATITAGGVGFPYANIRLKGEKGSGLNYIVEFYV